VDNHVAEALDAAFHVLEPDAGPREAVGGLDVVHQETVDVLEGRGFIEVSCQ